MRQKAGCYLRELRLFQCREVFGRGHGGILQSRSLKPHCLEYGVRVLFPKASDELVGMDGINTEKPQNRRRKIGYVERDDERRPRMNCSSQYMAVIGIRECQCRGQGLIPSDEAISDMQIH